MTRQFDPLKAGISPEALEKLYNIVLGQKLVLEAKLERIKKELAVGACALEDEQVGLDQAKQGMLNLIAYIEAKISIEDELDVDQGSIELVKKHLDELKSYYESKKEN